MTLASSQCRDGARPVFTDRQALLVPSANRREVFGGSHEGLAAPYVEPLVRRTFLHMDGTVE